MIRGPMDTMGILRLTSAGAKPGPGEAFAQLSFCTLYEFRSQSFSVLEELNPTESTTESIGSRDWAAPGLIFYSNIIFLHSLNSL